MKKNGILTLLFAFIPGAGQMYQGYMKRGLSLITMFCLFIIVGSTTGLDALVVGCIVVYMYSFFDTLNLRAQLAAEKAPEDDYLVHFNWHDARMTQFMGESHKLVGWGLIALGAIVFYNNIIMRVLGDVMWRWGQDNPVFLSPAPHPDAGCPAADRGLRGADRVRYVAGARPEKQKGQAARRGGTRGLPRLHGCAAGRGCRGHRGHGRPFCHAGAFGTAGGTGDRCRAGRDPCGG